MYLLVGKVNPVQKIMYGLTLQAFTCVLVLVAHSGTL